LHPAGGASAPVRNQRHGLGVMTVFRGWCRLPVWSWAGCGSGSTPGRPATYTSSTGGGPPVAGACPRSGVERHRGREAPVAPAPPQGS